MKTIDFPGTDFPISMTSCLHMAQNLVVEGVAPNLFTSAIQSLQKKIFTASVRLVQSVAEGDCCFQQRITMEKGLSIGQHIKIAT